MRFLADAGISPKTVDLDFGEILALGVRDRPSVVLFRLEGDTADSVKSDPAFQRLIASYSCIGASSSRPLQVEA